MPSWTHSWVRRGARLDVVVEAVKELTGTDPLPEP